MDKAWIERRLAGLSESGMTPGETRAMHASGYEDFVDAIGRIPKELQSALEEALRRCPSLVENESDPIRFLRRERFNGWAAALRLMEYWTARKNVFAHKAFLPMTLSSEGPLEEVDRGLLRAGAVCILPKNTNGRTVALIDRSIKIDDGVLSSLVKARMSFFVHQALSLDEASQVDGFVIIDVLSNPRGFDFSDGCLRLQDCLNSFPTKIHSMYVTLNVNELTREEFLQNALPKYLLSAGSLFRGMIVSIAGSTKVELLSQLEKHGFARTGVPVSFGGSWTFGGWDEDARESIEPTRRKKRGRYVPSDFQGAVACGELAQRIDASEEADDDVREVHDALALLPAYDKCAFVEASSLAPHLVKLESNPSVFLLCENRDPWAAAKRIATYWSKRKSIFGDRAFLPLDLSGSGALSEEDVMVFQSCYLVQLPDAATEQSVICFNQALAPREFPVASQWRALFYLAHVCAKNEVSVRDGVISLHILTQLPSAPPEEVLGALDLWKSSLPVRLDSCHFLCIKPINTLTSSMRSWLQLIQHNSQISYWGGVYAHIVNSGLDVAAKLGPFGVVSSGIPVSIGGSWSYSNGVVWVQQRSMPASLSNPVPSNSSLLDRESLPTKRTKKLTTKEEESKRVPMAADAEASPTTMNVLSDDEAFPEGFVETATVSANGLEQMEQAIACLPEEDKADLFQARREVPELVEKESPMLRFLRYEKYNSWAAARRYAAYWRNRKFAFGDRCFLPMNQTGEGALTRDDIVSLSTGYVAFLRYDDRGRSVLLYDSSRRVNHSRETRLRCSFYVWNILAENTMSQDDGYVGLSILGRPTLDRTMKECIALVEEAIPARCSEAHIVNCPSVSGHSSFMNTMVPLMLQIMGPFLEKHVRVHVADTRAELAEKLVACGFQKTSLPKCIGGEWGYEMFSQWQENRLRYEWDLPPGVNSGNQPHVPLSNSKTIAEMTEEEKAERKRRMNVLHSRRRRERERVEMEVFSERVADLRDKNGMLKQENEKLERMLFLAKAAVARLGPMSQTKATPNFEAPCSPLHVAGHALVDPTSAYARGSPPALARSSSINVASMPSPQLAGASRRDVLDQALQRSRVDSDCGRAAYPINEATLHSSPAVFENPFLLPHMLPDSTYVGPLRLNDEEEQKRLLQARRIQLECLLAAQRAAAPGPRRTAEQLLNEQLLQQQGQRNADMRNEQQGFLAGLFGIPTWFS